MTIDEAIKGSQEAVVFLSLHHQDRLAKAVGLGIEALKRVQELRPYHDPEPTWLLPGETEKGK